MTRSVHAVLGATALMIATTIPARAHAQGLQLEANIFDGSGVSAGVWLDGGVALLAGVRAASVQLEQEGYEDMRSFAWEVPVEAKIYLAEVRPAAFVPCLVAGVGYGQASFQETNLEMLQGRALLGIDYFVSAAFAVHASAGGFYRHVWGPESRERSYGILWRAGVVLRP